MERVHKLINFSLFYLVLLIDIFGTVLFLQYLGFDIFPIKNIIRDNLNLAVFGHIIQTISYKIFELGEYIFSGIQAA